MTERTIFLAALDIDDPSERAAYVDRACGADAGLRGQVENLLKAHGQSGEFMDQPAPALVATIDQPPAAEGPGTVVGMYKLLERIGEGGFGVVFLAEQAEPVRRKVALKILKPGMDTRQVVARFEAERQALAIMDHPNIARVFDGGATPSGRPYFVMELVKGAPITELCDRNHFTPRHRLELFAQVCAAVQHAHQKGIIHRDLKPSNVLVSRHDTQPVVKVIDFGVAKALRQELTDKTLFTGLAQMVGTPLYMSPEQAGMSDLDVDTRSDIYSLGVLLYELLTGTTPFTAERFKQAGYDEIRRIIREEEPPKPSTRLSESRGTLLSVAARRQTEPAKLTRLVRGELDWIVMKALEKDRNRRYDTANGFAMDVQRYLADEPVQACPPSVGYRFRKFARRNKAGLATAGLVLFFIVLLGGVVGWGMRDRAAREQEIAQESARKLALTEAGIRQALDRAATSRAVLHAILKKPGGVQELLNQPARWELFIRTSQGELAQARRLADRAEGSLGADCTQGMDQLEQQLTSDQADYDLALRLERISLDTVAREIVRFSRLDTIAEYEAALAPYGVLGDDPAAVAARLAASPIREQLVAALDECAMTIYVSHKHLAERLLTIARLTAPDPVWGDRVRQLAVWDDRQALEKLAMEAPTARLAPRLTCIVGEGLRIKGSAMSVICLRRAQAQHPADFWLNFNLGHALSRTNPAEAVGFYRAALAIRPGTSAVYNNLGTALADQKRFAEAIEAYHKAIDLDPKNAGKPHVNLGRALYQQGEVAEAIKAFNKAIEINSKADYAYVQIGRLYRDQKLWQKSIHAFHKAIEINSKKATTHYDLGLTLYLSGNFKEAADAYEKAIEIDQNYADAYCNLGLALQRLGKPDEAVTACTKAIQINPKHANAYSIRGDALADLGKDDEAIANYLEAIGLNPNHAHAHNNLANALLNRGKTDVALDAYRTAIKLAPKNAHFRICCALVLTTCPDPKFRDPREAVEHAKKAVELQSQYGLAWQVLGWAQYRAGDFRQSIEALEKSCKVEPGGMGGHSQWIVLALAHARLAEQPGLPDKARESHKIEARRWYEQADKSIDSKWRVRPGYRVGDLGQPIWDFREEARALMPAEVDKK